MVGPGCVLVPSVFVTLIGWSYLFDVKRGGAGILGVLMGTSIFVVLLSAWFLTVMFKDFRERHRYPNRIGIGYWGVLPPIIFAGSIFVSHLLYQMIQQR